MKNIMRGDTSIIFAFITSFECVSLGGGSVLQSRSLNQNIGERR